MTNEQKSWKERLQKLGISQIDFANSIGESEAVICLYFNLNREPGASKFEKIKEALERLEADAAVSP